MAKQIIPEELEALIKEYLTDGVLTDKERKVILNKAVNMGLDYDEIDLYLDAQEQKVEQSIDAAARKQKGKVCPFCGKPVPQLAEKCPECGETLTAEASSELQEIFDNLEDALVDLKSGSHINKSKATVERYARKAKMYYGSNPKVQKLLDEIEAETINAEKKAKALARSEAISNVASSVSHGFVATVKYFALEHKKLTAAIIFILICIPTCKWLATNMDPEAREAAEWEERIAKETEEKEQKQAEIKAFNENVMKLINSGNLDEANMELSSLTSPDGLSHDDIKDAYDAVFMKICKAYIKNKDYDSAEDMGVAFKAIIGYDYYWSESSTYKYLETAFEKAGVDFSALKY